MKILINDVEYKYAISDLIKNLKITKMGVIKRLRKNKVKGILLPGQRLYSQEEFNRINEES